MRTNDRRRVLRRPRFLPEGRRLSDAVWLQRHRGLTALLALHIPTLFLFGVLRGAGVVDVAVQTGFLLLPLAVAVMPRFSRNIRSTSTSLGLVIAASILVHLAGGSIEAHFEFFVIIAFLSLYQAWLPFLVALFYIVIEHGLVGALDPQAVYNNRADIAHPWLYASIHGGFILAASFANLLSWRITEQEALRDGLTGLPNRVYFLDYLNGALEHRNRSIAVMFLDLDNFKDANDAFGHDVGDVLLQRLSQRLRYRLREDDVLARLGGDEFAVALVGMPDRAATKELAERLVAACSEPLLISGVTITPSVSIGIAYDSGSDSAAELLRNADLAMYDAKRGGGSNVADYRPELHAVALRRTELESELRSALDNDEFVVHYQPIFDLSTLQLVGTEALVRWEHPVRGTIAPMEFIPAAEQAGLIVALGSWVLRTACDQTASWQSRYPDRPPLFVSVNLSARQVADRTLVTTISQTLREARLDASSLRLELTETAVIGDFDAIVPVLNALRDLRVSLALDDFGTGFSSLSYLSRLPVDSVKIDRSFVAEVDEDSNSAQIVLAIIDLAHALGLTVTAEGVESDAQLQTLRAMNSEHAQGFALARPAPADAITALIDAGTTIVHQMHSPAVATVTDRAGSQP